MTPLDSSVIAAASTGFGQVSASLNLLSYLENEVAELSEKHFQRAQYPIASSQGQDFPLALVTPSR